MEGNRVIRSVDDQELLALVERAVKDAIRNGRKDVPGSAQARVRKYLAGRPTLPRLLGVTEAAQVLGVRKPHLYRLRDQGRLPLPLLTLMAGQLFLEDEIQVLADELTEERRSRESKRQLRTAKAAEKAAAAAEKAAA